MDYKPIAKGEDVIVPHIGNVDTIQIPIDIMWYVAQELPRTDLARLRNEPEYRAILTQSITETLASSLDAEYMQLLITAAAAQPGGTIELRVPKIYNPQKDVDLYLTIADIGTQLEKKINAYYIGTPRSDLVKLTDPYLYTREIKSLGGFYLAIEPALNFIQNESIQASKISGITIVRHIFLDNVVTQEATNNFSFYDFTGYRAIIFSRAAAFVVPVLNESAGVINKDNFNYRFGQRVILAKGIVYGDLIRVIKEPSTTSKPLPLEEHMVKNTSILTLASRTATL